MVTTSSVVHADFSGSIGLRMEVGQYEVPRYGDFHPWDLLLVVLRRYGCGVFTDRHNRPMPFPLTFSQAPEPAIHGVLDGGFGRVLGVAS